MGRERPDSLTDTSQENICNKEHFSHFFHDQVTTLLKF